MVSAAVLSNKFSTDFSQIGPDAESNHMLMVGDTKKK